MITEEVRVSLIHEILDADDSILMRESIKRHSKEIANWKDSLESKGLKTNNQKIQLMGSGSKGELPISKINPK